MASNREAETASDKSDDRKTTIEDLDQSKDTTMKATSESTPDGGYGWVVVACVFLINMHSWGLNSSYGVFLAHFVNDGTYPNAGILDFSFIAGLSVSVAFLLAPFSTWCVGKFGTRTTILLGTFFETLSLIAASFTTQIWQLFLTQGLCFGIGLGFLYVASVGLIPQWFTTRRSFANAIGTAGSGMGGLVYNLASQAVLQRADFRWAYRMIGICAFVVNLICGLLARDRNKAIGANLRLWEGSMFRRLEFNFLQLFGFFSMLGYLVLIYSLPEYATSVGLTASQGSVIGALLNLGQALGRPLVGLFSDRIGRINISASLTVLCGIFCLVWWTQAKSFATLVSFAILCGTVSGTYWATVAPVSAEVIGLRDLPVALSMTWICLVLPVTFSEVIALEIESHTGYLYAQIYTGLCYIVAGACLWVVRVWKIGQLERLAAEEKISADSSVAVQPTETPGRRDARISHHPKSGIVRRIALWKRV